MTNSSKNDVMLDVHEDKGSKGGRVLYYSLDTILNLIKCTPLVNADFTLRMGILYNKDIDIEKVNCSTYSYDYWYRICELVRPSYLKNYKPKISLLQEKAPEKPLCFFSSARNGSTGGFETTLTRSMLYQADEIRIDFPENAEDSIGMLEGFLPLAAKALGYCTCYIGDERYTGNNLHSIKSDSIASFEQTELWWRLWNAYSSPFTVQSVLGIWKKSEIVEKVYRMYKGDLSKVSSCNNWTKEHPWCGKCWKCFSTKIILHSRNVDHSFIKLDKEACRVFVDEYDNYMKNGTDYFRSCGIIEDAGGIPPCIWD